MPVPLHSYLFMKQQQELPPDSDEQLQLIKKSLQFIGSFCIKNKIQLAEYAIHKTGVTYDWMKQLKRHEISIYSLMEFQEIYVIITKAQDDEKELFLGDVGKYFLNYKSKYLTSILAKQLVTEGIKKIDKIIKEKT